MDVCNELCLSGWPAVRPSWYGKSCNIGHYKLTFQPDFFIATIGATRSEEIETSWLHFFTLFK